MGTPYDETGNPQSATLTSYYFGGTYEVTGSDVKKYYSFGGQTVMRDADGLQYFLTDHLGSVVAITNASGTLTSQQRYLPFGGVRSDITTPNAPNSDLGYTGQRMLDSGMGGLMDYKARFYSPLLGRFTQPDSIVPNAANPQAFNRYSYVLNNPARYTDPTGHWFETALDVAFIAYDIYDISQNGLNWENGLALTADVASAILPVVTGGGVLVRMAMHADDAVDAVKVVDKTIDAVNTADNVTDAFSHGDSIIEKARKVFKYDGKLPAGSGSTDMFGNITISPHGTDLDRSLAKFHEEVHSFFTPKGPFQEARAKFSMWAYQNSDLLRYTEEAIAETVAQIRTKGSVWNGIKFPIVNSYVSTKRLLLESGGLIAGIYASSKKLAERFDK